MGAKFIHTVLMFDLKPNLVVDHGHLGYRSILDVYYLPSTFHPLTDLSYRVGQNFFQPPYFIAR